MERLKGLIAQYLREIGESKSQLNEMNLKIPKIQNTHTTTIDDLTNNHALLIDQLKDDQTKQLLNL